VKSMKLQRVTLLLLLCPFIGQQLHSQMINLNSAWVVRGDGSSRNLRTVPFAKSQPDIAVADSVTIFEAVEVGRCWYSRSIGANEICLAASQCDTNSDLPAVSANQECEVNPHVP
jgi:hypothetical protein